MHIKHLHCMIEELAGGLKENVTACMKPNEVGIIGATVDMLKDLCEAEYYARMAKCLEKDEEEEKEEEKYMLRMLKEEHGMSEEDSRRFYDAWRYKNGRFAPKGRGTRRGYEEPPYYHMNPEMYKEHDPEWYRDMDRASGKMYYTDGGSGMSGSNMGGNSAGSAKGYSDGYDEGQRRGYSEGYERGNRDGRSQGGRRDGREGRSGQSRRSYMETKEMNKGNTPQEKQEKMKELEKYMGELGSDITEMISDASNEEKTMLKSKLQTLVQKIS